MIAMPDLILTITTAVVAGGLAGYITGRRRRSSDSWVDDTTNFERDVDENERIEASARAWAETHDRPGADWIVAEKLRLASRLNRRVIGRRSR